MFAGFAAPVSLQLTQQGADFRCQWAGFDWYKMYKIFMDLEGFPLLVVVESSCTLETEPKGAARSCELSGAVLLQL